MIAGIVLCSLLSIAVMTSILINVRVKKNENLRLQGINAFYTHHSKTMEDIIIGLNMVFVFGFAALIFLFVYSDDLTTNFLIFGFVAFFGILMIFLLFTINYDKEGIENGKIHIVRYFIKKEFDVQDVKFISFNGRNLSFNNGENKTLFHMDLATKGLDIFVSILSSYGAKLGMEIRDLGQTDFSEAYVMEQDKISNQEEVVDSDALVARNELIKVQGARIRALVPSYYKKSQLITSISSIIIFIACIILYIFTKQTVLLFLAVLFLIGIILSFTSLKRSCSNELERATDLDLIMKYRNKLSDVKGYRKNLLKGATMCCVSIGVMLLLLSVITGVLSAKKPLSFDNTISVNKEFVSLRTDDGDMYFTFKDDEKEYELGASYVHATDKSSLLDACVDGATFTIKYLSEDANDNKIYIYYVQIGDSVYLDEATAMKVDANEICARRITAYVSGSCSLASFIVLIVFAVYCEKTKDKETIDIVL